MQAPGRAAGGPGCAYFTGGASALLIGWRQSTVDVDLLEQSVFRKRRLEALSHSPD